MSKYADAIKELLIAQGEKPEEIEATLKVIKTTEDEKYWESARSWISVGISFFALIISIIAIYTGIK